VLTVNNIQKLFDAKAYGRLLNAVAGNGLELPRALGARLARVPAGAVALGLRRVVELTYHPTDLSGRMAQFLIATQDRDGSFERDPVVTAMAAAAWGRMLAEQPAGATPQIVAAKEHALGALALMQQDDGLFDTSADWTCADRALTGAFVFYTLADDEAFGKAVNIAALWRWFEQRHRTLERDTERLWRMGCAEVRGGRLSAAALAA
jgi:hypothetical protein